MPVLESSEADSGQEELVSLISDYTSPVSLGSSSHHDVGPGPFLEIE